jgi:glutamine synthetase
MSAEELKNVPSMPGSLEESLQALEGDYDFLLANQVFTGELIERWIEYKRGHEINPVRMRPHPIEFSMYFDA